MPPVGILRISISNYIPDSFLSRIFSVKIRESLSTAERSGTAAASSIRWAPSCCVWLPPPLPSLVRQGTIFFSYYYSTSFAMPDLQSVSGFLNIKACHPDPRVPPVRNRAARFAVESLCSAVLQDAQACRGAERVDGNRVVRRCRKRKNNIGKICVKRQ